MKKIILAASLLLSSSFAYADEPPATFDCMFQNGDNFTVVGQSGVTVISWNGGPFNNVKAEFQDPFLYVAQEGDRGNFAMRWNIRTNEADGWTKFNDGSVKGGPLFCRFKR